MATQILDQIFDITVKGISELGILEQRYAKLNQSQRKLTTSTNALGNELKKDHFSGIDSRGRRWSSTITSLDGKTRTFTYSMSQATGVTKRLSNSIKALNSIARITGGVILGSLVSRGVAALTNAMIGSVSAAAEFSLKIGEIRTISQNSQLSFERWSQSVRQLSDAFGTPIVEVAEGAYQALSNQIAEGAETTQFLAEAQRLAVISVASTDDAVLALTGTLNAYNLGAEEARNVSDAFFKTIELGRLRLSEIAGDIGRVNILGANLGVTYQEVDAALATLTIQGVNAAEGMTFLRNVFLKLTRPTKYMKQLFAEWGVSSGQAAIATFGFQGVLQKLADRAAQAADPMDELGQIFGRIRAIIGGTGLVNALDRFNDNLKEIVSSSKSADEALEIMRNNIGYRFRVEMNKTANFFKVDVGQKIVKTIVELSDKVGGLANIFETSFKAIATAGEFLIFLFGTRLVVAVGAWVSTMKMAAYVQGGLFLGNMLIATRAMKAQAVAVYALSAAYATLTKAIALLGPALLAYLSYKVIRDLYKGVDEINFANTQLTQDFIDESNVRQQKWNEEIDNLVEGATSGLQQAAQQYDQLAAAIRGALNELYALADAQRAFNDLLYDLEFDVLEREGRVREAEALALDRIKNAQDKLREFLGSREQLNDAQLETIENLIKDVRAQVRRLDSLKREFETQIRERIRILPPGAGRDADVELKRLRENFKRVNDESRLGTTILRNLLNLAKQIGRQRLGADVTEFDTPAAQRQIEDASAAYDEARADLQGLLDQLQAFGTESKQSEKEINDFLLEVSKIGQTLNDQFKTLRESKSITGFLLRGNENIAAFLESLNQLNDAAKETDATNFNQLAEAIKGLQEFFASKTPEDFEALSRASKAILNIDAEQAETVKTALDEIAGKLNDIEDAFAAKEARRNLLQQLSEQMNISVEDIEAKVQAMIADIQSGVTAFENFERTGATSVAEVTQQFRDATKEIARLAAQARQLVAEILAARQRAQQGGYFGKYITRQAGGSIGKDSVSILADPREFIMNAKSTSKFLPQLVAMNSGSRRFESGGPVTNNNIGDINVNVTQPNSSAREIAAQIRRELTRSTVRLN